MRILMTTDAAGGVWTFTQELCTALLSQHHAVCLISFGLLPSAAQQSWAQQQNANGEFLFAACDAPLEWMADNKRCWSEGSALLQRMLEQFRPDVLHLNQFCFGAWPSELPKIVTAHSDVLSWAEACDPDALRQSPWLDTYCELVQAGLDGADRVVAPTQWMLQALQRNFPAAAGKCSVIPNGRNLCMNMPAQKLRQAVAIGRLWDRAKGIDTLLHVDWPIPLNVAGDVAFDAAHAPPGSAKNVTWLGRLAEDEIVALLQQSSIYVGASRYEPFGLAPLEAALCGCALLLRDLPSFREVWGDAALFFHDSAHLRQLVKTAAADAGRLADLRTAAYARASTYTVERMTVRYLDLYREVQGERSCAELCVHAA